MSVQAHLESLEKKHGQLEEELRNELGSPSAADGAIAELKRRKLRLKDEIVRLKDEVVRH
ncbi:DUF465 domain-containing protein [Pseudohoeflea suaedae]|uniref:DUF465 domain-containing protein n=1 Tax=Pseudohoeflea suaedae TaxID=877384 RepID=A0A4R5PJW4_9HYPH|nr:DUF465 domain-containing protein [Pseudohoeflea suaedae]TDH35875.1 DUF465 domain-containing protein [Pseudohoeflea suaedae]